MSGEVQSRNGLYGFEFRDVDHRRTPEDEPRKRYEIKSLWQRSHEIVNLAARGFKQTDIAEVLGITPACVSDTLNSELGKLKLSEVRFSRDEEAKKTSEKIRILTDKALATYHEIFDNESGEATLRDRKDVADTIVLELSGLRVPTKIQSQSVSTVLTKKELEEFKNRGKKAAEGMGLVIDITPEPDESAESKIRPPIDGDNSLNDEAQDDKA
jgi:predicted transcriptional regulator